MSRRSPSRWCPHFAHGPNAAVVSARHFQQRSLRPPSSSSDTRRFAPHFRHVIAFSFLSTSANACFHFAFGFAIAASNCLAPKACSIASRRQRAAYRVISLQRLQSSNSRSNIVTSHPTLRKCCARIPNSYSVTRNFLTKLAHRSPLRSLATSSPSNGSAMSKGTSLSKGSTSKGMSSAIAFLLFWRRPYGGAFDTVVAERSSRGLDLLGPSLFLSARARRFTQPILTS